jgi:hypothetical protein
MLNSDPLMFIETAGTKSVPNGRTIYDSRYDKEVKLEEEKEVQVVETLKISEETLSRLESIVELYQMTKPVLCDIKTIDGNYEGIPVEIKDENVYVKHKGDILTLKLNGILEIIILRV